MQILKHLKYAFDKKEMARAYASVRADIERDVGNLHKMRAAALPLPKSVAGNLTEEVDLAIRQGEECLRRVDALLESLAEDRVGYFMGQARALHSSTSRFAALSSKIDEHLMEIRANLGMP